ncbi:MAG: hypothetical protein IK139_03105, partial [Lachnospiraceae bacterium]|nr:hypothetical protein [Lachnospiraceae bacterium]
TVDCPSVKQMSEKNKIYDSKENVIDVGDDTFIEGIIHKIDDWFQLRKGDILAREGHVHLYLGDGMAVDAPNFGWGRVYRSFPQTYEIEIKTLNDEKVISLKNGDGNIEYYPRIYRYRGTEDT